jgi:uncharacterized protein
MLVLPPGKGPFPAALYMSGGGPGMAAYFVSFAEALAQKGIAVLVYDKRGCGQSTGDFKASHYPEFQQDAMCGFEFLRKQSQINPNKVGFIGHSEGGMITEMIAAEHSDVAFAVLMAAPGMRGDRLRGRFKAYRKAKPTVWMRRCSRTFKKSSPNFFLCWKQKRTPRCPAQKFMKF